MKKSHLVLLLVSVALMSVGGYGLYNSSHTSYDSIIPTNMAKKAVGWRAQYGTNQIVFATEGDLQIFQSWDVMKQERLIIANTGCTVHFSTQADSNTLVIGGK